MAYTQSEKVNKAEKDYYDYLKNKPGEFTSENTQKAKDALAAYENRGEFKYNPATDSGYQAARKQYTAGGKQAMKDTLGTATELTGGYDNSYAQAAAQQTYNNYMAELANLMPQYEGQAYDRWQAEGDRMIDYYGILKNAEAQDYSMYRDNVNDYYSNVDRLYGQYMDAYNTDYGMYRDNVADQQYADEIAYRDARDAIEDQRYADQWAYEQQQYADQLALQQAQLALQQEQWAHQQAQDELANEQWWAQYYSSQASGDVDEPLFYEYAGAINDDLGNRTGTRYYYDGKEVEYDLGINPYTNTTNPDTKYGTFKNGYQPDNVGGVKLKESDYEPINLYGVSQKIWTAGGRYYYWNGRTNRYEDITDRLEEV